jgi:processing peptidase subunit beta
MGGQLNAYTSREHTVFYARVFKDDVPKAIDILADVIQNSIYDPKHIEAEKSTILREMEEVGKQYNEVIFDHLHAAAYQGTPLARTILGPESNIKTITRDDLLSFVKSCYQGPRIVLAGAGALKHEQLVELANKSFITLPTGNLSPKKYPTAFTGSEILIRDDTMDTVHLALAVEAVGWSHPDYFTFMVLQQLIGNWDRSVGGGKNLSSKLCETFAVEELAYSLNSFFTSYK